MTLAAAVPQAPPAKGRQNFIPVANDYAAICSVRQIDRDISAGARRRRKNHTVDTHGNPDSSQFL